MNVKETTVPVDAAHILVVDDSALNRKKISMAVETLGHRVSVAEDGQSALDLLRCSKPSRQTASCATSPSL